MLLMIYYVYTHTHKYFPFFMHRLHFLGVLLFKIFLHVKSPFLFYNYRENDVWKHWLKSNTRYTGSHQILF